jgi:hypothetical protein
MARHNNTRSPETQQLDWLTRAAEWDRMAARFTDSTVRTFCANRAAFARHMHAMDARIDAQRLDVLRFGGEA